MFFLLNFLTACGDDFSIEEPSVHTFVDKLVKGKYDYTEQYGDKGQVRLKMPRFSYNNIPELLAYARDTTHIEGFPVNPAAVGSSLPSSRSYYILGEGLLWIVEGLRKGSHFGSLYPYLIKVDETKPERFRTLNGGEILEVYDLYLNWWKSLNDSSAVVVYDPLRYTDYYWR